MHMKGSASLDPEGLPALFYHYYWDIISNDITNKHGFEYSLRE